ncbi:MAG: hypothetical protein CEN91_376 [Candidatus Berkelbacteria bacterium Licking1014_85]|uniref:DUF86 domain-containing protein n=1 Tax=Candidatus Berkelbacteria bacterium Licking1014_85 TaxID=2017148 RepID=A0A554LIL8_9BACT|nr:MAG: hypothetical protein CEN91_376 [Candidatus Berkelbacteria bacterium Licking1014_85]
MDKILKLRKVKGETMGERLKNATNIYPRETLSDLWNLHKLRNRIVHEESEIMSFEINPILEKINRLISSL